MDLQDAIMKRYSCRSFDSSRTVGEDVVFEIVTMGLRAPSAGNRQPWKIYAVQRKNVIKALAAAAFGQDFITQAPVVLAVCIDLIRASQGYGRRGIELYSIQDTAALIENMLLAAVNAGLGACWVGAFNEEECSRVLGCSHNERPVAIVPLGIPLGEGHKTGRRPAGDVVTWLL